MNSARLILIATSGFCFFLSTVQISAPRKYKGLEFSEPCKRTDPDLESCLTKSVNNIATRFKDGRVKFFIKDFNKNIICLNYLLMPCYEKSSDTLLDLPEDFT